MSPVLGIPQRFLISLVPNIDSNVDNTCRPVPVFARDARRSFLCSALKQPFFLQAELQIVEHLKQIAVPILDDFGLVPISVIVHTDSGFDT